MVEPQGSDRFQFNVYGVFCNFLPGSVLLIGLTIPFILTPESLIDLNLTEALAAGVGAFALGILTQALGSKLSRRKVFGSCPHHKRDRPFNKKMDDMLSSDSCEDELTNIDRKAKRICTEVFDCEDEYDTDHIFKSLVAYLEASNFTRGLRVQALHLASRGLYVASLILFIYYSLFAVGLYLPPGFSIFTYYGVLHLYHFSLLSLLTLPVAYILFERARDFESDVASYIFSEIVVSQYDWNKLDISDLESKKED